MSTSYPFLTFARQHGLEYWAVLCVADSRVRKSYNEFDYWERKAWLEIVKEGHGFHFVLMIDDLVESLRR